MVYSHAYRWLLIGLFITLSTSCGNRGVTTSRTNAVGGADHAEQGSPHRHGANATEFQENIPENVLQGSDESLKMKETQSDVLAREQAAAEQKSPAKELLAQRQKTSQQEPAQDDTSQIEATAEKTPVLAHSGKQQQQEENVQQVEVEATATKEKTLADGSDAAPREEDVDQELDAAKTQQLLCAPELISHASMKLPQTLLVGFTEAEGEDAPSYLHDLSWHSLEVKTQGLSVSFAGNLQKDVSSYKPNSENSAVSLDLLVEKSVADLRYFKLSWIYMASIKTQDPLIFSEQDLLEVLLSKITQNASLTLNERTFDLQKLLKNKGAKELSHTKSQVVKKENFITVFSEITLEASSSELSALLGSDHSLCATEENALQSL